MQAGRKELILNIALPVPLRKSFDYLLDNSLTGFPLQPGLRVKVPFGKSKICTGLLLGTSRQTELPDEKLKFITGFVDRDPLLDGSHLQFLEWASNYYHHPIGEVVFNTLPVPLKRGNPLKGKTGYSWQLTDTGRSIDINELQHAPRQARLLQMLQTIPAGELRQEFKKHACYAALKSLQRKGLVQKVETKQPDRCRPDKAYTVTLNSEQRLASDTVCSNLGQAKRFLLYGVTGSGKTEVYIDIIRKVIAAGGQALILVPEIGLTPQLIQRLQGSIDAHLAVLHSSLSDGDRLQSWIEARDGTASIILGTRSAIWTPLQAPGVIIVDEEHDLSYKQQEGFRYSARDVAIMRAKMAGIPVILGSATPSMESLKNAGSNNYINLTLGRRSGDAQHPMINIIDMRARQMVGALSRQLADAISEELRNKQQTLLFLNQRGFSPVIMCHNCGWMAKCQRCDRRMTYHKFRNRYECHHCNSEASLVSVCPDCSSRELLQIGHGTERLHETLEELYPDARILRIDRDTTRRKGTMKKMIDIINAGDADILIGTQMLAKGHHFPQLTLVGIIDSDRGLFSSDFRASERMAQLFIQVSGRAGREEKAGKVLIQTHYPQHPLIQSMLCCDYGEFSKIILKERQAANLPPFSHLALLRAEDYHIETVDRFLTEAKTLLSKACPELEILGPMPAILEKRAGRMRCQLVIQSGNRYLLQQALEPWSRTLETLSSAGKVRWSLDIDPQEMV